MSEPNEENMSDEEAILKIASAMKDNAPMQEERHNIHTFLTNVVQTEQIDKLTKVGNLRDDKELNELGVPRWHVRGGLEMARISEKIMNNKFFQEYFQAQVSETLATSLSREGFLIKMGTVTTKQVADVTKRKKTNKGWFGKSTTEESGGDTVNSQTN